MATKVIMPKQGLQMTEGTIINWLFKEGERVEKEQSLFEMETDKLTIDIGAPVSGTLLKIIKAEGEVVPVTEMIAVIGEPGEDISQFISNAKVQAASCAGTQPVSDSMQAASSAADAQARTNSEGCSEHPFITPRAKMKASEEGVEYHNIKGSGFEGTIIEKDILAHCGQALKKNKVTPVAERVAQIQEVKLSEVVGTGMKGKVTKADVLATVALRAARGPQDRAKTTVMPFTGMRKAIADKMMQSLHSMAQANHRMKVNMSETVRFREKLKADGIKVSYTDIMVKAVARALLDFPVINSTLATEGIVFKEFVNMGLAVAVDKGLVVPVIKDADIMTLQEISQVAAELAVKAKSGGLKPEDCQGGTFTLTNLGMYDIDEFTAVINYPESAILAIGKIQKEAVVENDSIVIQPIMVLSLTYDHRVIDGAPAAQFLQRVKQILQDPYLLI